MRTQDMLICAGVLKSWSHQRHRSGRRSRNARKAAFGQSTYDELRTDPHWSAQPASLFAGYAAETLRYAGPYLDVMRGR
jgi:hypothetical protein